MIRYGRLSFNAKTRGQREARSRLPLIFREDTNVGGADDRAWIASRDGELRCAATGGDAIGANDSCGAELLIGHVLAKALLGDLKRGEAGEHELAVVVGRAEIGVARQTEAEACADEVIPS